MPTVRKKAFAEFKRLMTWIVGMAILMVFAALTYLHLSGGLETHMVIATVLGVFFSVVLGSGLFAAAFFSDKSGHDQSISDATSGHKDGDRE
jgi:hypothetical protein